LAKAVDKLERELMRSAYVDGHITGLTIKAPQDEADDYLAVLRRVSAEGEPQVAFHGSENFGSLLVGIANRIGNGTMKWHPDKYAGQKQ
jgi:hypothetical protein